MSDTVIVDVAGRPCALTLDQVREGHVRAERMFPAAMASPSATQGVEPLLDAEACAQVLGMTARWLEDMARAGVVPHYKFGRFIRFRASEVAEHARASGAAIPGTNLAATDFASDAVCKSLTGKGGNGRTSRRSPGLPPADAAQKGGQ